MSLRAVELTLLAREISAELGGGVVQKVHAPTTARVYLELRVPGRSSTVLLCAEPGAARVSCVEDRPPNPPTPPTWQSVLRRELCGARLLDAEAIPARRTLVVHLERGAGGGRRTLVLETGQHPAVALLAEGGAVMTQSLPSRDGLRVGQRYEPLDAVEVREGQPSRLQSDHVHLRLLHGAEALFRPVEERRWLDARRAPVMARLKRLRRTMDKVAAERDRGGLAEQARREAELLQQNFARLRRGATEVTVDEYLADGTVRPVTIALSPARTPREEIDHRFNQYRRLSRGVGLASRRLAALEEEERRLADELARLDLEPVEAPALPPPPTRKGQDQALPPYREYLGSGGQRIWVGRGAAHNDELTFHVARPHHVWFHARGVPGAHVVVPREKTVALSQEVMLDAAHLAAHHSDAKGEPRAEVSYTEVKYVRKAGAPGAVTYTREKTVLLRVEPERLRALLATAEGA